MPIVSISKIQHRYGLSENLPQLSAAELGWVIDKRKLYIGNGPTSEGAPTIGNTEILTQYSNLLEVADNAYSYKDLAVGFEAITGDSVSDPITRNLQSKLDDFANVRDYGAKGNGLIDDTDAITRALNDLFTRETSAAVRRVLYFPAGNYLVRNAIKIPPYATLQGEGKNCTFITATDNTESYVARIVDSKLQSGANVGANGAVLPVYVAINDLTFNANSLGIDVFAINAAKNVSFRNVCFDGGSIIAPATAGTQKAALRIFSTAITHSSSIVFDNCEFSGTNYAAVLDDDMENVVFDKCTFKKLYLGFKIGQTTLGTGASIYGPRGLRITNSLFDEIYNSAIVNYQNAKITSAFNTYLNVGNQSLTTPTYPVIILNGDESASICDTFARLDVDNLISPRVSYGSTKSIYIESNSSIFVGKRQIQAGDVVTLADATGSATSTTISFSIDQKTQKINYVATRGAGVRSGVFEVTGTDAGVTFVDTYTENSIDIGLTLTAELDGDLINVFYVTTTNGNDVSFSYSVDRNIA